VSHETAIDTIMTTRAIRHFSDEPVTDEEILTCLRAAQQAPSGGNVQPTQYVVVTDPSTKAVIGDLYRRAYERYERTLPDASSFRTPEEGAAWERNKAASAYLAEHLGEAPALVLFLMPIIPWTPSDDEGPMDIGPLYASVYPAVQNFCVAARSLGIGTALTTVIRIHTAEVLAAIGAPEGRFEIAALVPMGRPAGRFGQAPRKPVEKRTHWNRFGGPRQPD
jgi:nitroreductase